MSDTSAVPSGWSALADASPEDRVASMTETFTAIAGLDEARWSERIGALLAEEATLEDKALQAMAGGRLRALTALDIDAACSLTVAWEQAEKTQPANLGMRRVFALQAAAKSLSLDEVSRVEPFMPTVRPMAGLAPARSDRPIAAGDLMVDAPAPKKGFLGKLFSRS